MLRVQIAQDDQGSAQQLKAAGLAAQPHRTLAIKAGVYPAQPPRRVVNKLEDNVFNDLPLLLAVPRAAKLLGISRAAAYRLAASGELPVRRHDENVDVVMPPTRGQLVRG